ncbi:MAG TPA: histidinol dehydrogenase [Saprospiraceae bacterium]|nr:histidinol dehydrogenase [Saprospiraceae bacterium]MCB9271487.1 histidinol dehydrogenase [Lewinellaceae bacterium]HPR00303.1 histidinol dehydrogenase [Saprospiraceae bacterium]HRV87247.1 histidinol dehydrogenase [Saprospiraceae bacterium]
MQQFNQPARDRWPDLVTRPVMDWSQITGKVQPILDAVRKEGDAALRRFTAQFDGVDLDVLFVTEQEIKAAYAQIDGTLLEAIRTAAKNIERFHRLQKDPERKMETSPGVSCWQKSVPIEKVGLYIPGGTAPLFSTILMLAIPARIAGCREIILCTPPDKNGNLIPEMLVAAHEVGVSRIFKAGGAQAIAAMAYGTSSIPRVFKIFGPGNQYVTAAKQLVQQQGVAIDLPAGPSEVLVWAGKGSMPAFLASDLLSQAEHGVDSQVVLVADDQALIAATLMEVDRQCALLPRKELALGALANSKAIILREEQDMIDFVNAYAPEHLIITGENADQRANQVVNAGSVFIGDFTPESAGDYASGTNHTLPTNGYARSYSGVNLDAYLKKITFQKITTEGLQNLGPAIVAMAKAEQLEAHARAVSIRLQNINDQPS